MDRPRLLEDILAQPTSLSRVLSHHSGDGLGALLEAARVIRGARNVIVVGMGASLHACIPLQYQLAQEGMQVVVVEAAELLHYQRQICRGSVVLLVSRSGESVEIVKLLPHIKNLASCTIGVTNEPTSTLGKGSDLLLTIGCLQDEMVAIQSYTATVLVLMLLASAIARDLSGTREALQRILASMPSLIAASLASLQEWDGFFKTESLAPIYLLGRGPSYASCLEGALLFNETAKAPATGMAAGSFRHGPVEIVDSDFRGLIFAPQGATADINRALARDLVRFGGEVRVIGPCDGTDPTLRIIEVPATHEMFAPLLEIIPVQLAALRRAQLRGLRVGKFRHAQQVARDEATFSPGPR
jgi:glucosamine--fructose-6-phosphate aminotransferase (isomerizing)